MDFRRQFVRVRTRIFPDVDRKYVAHLELVDGREVAGWAFRREDPAQPVEIEIVADGVVLGTTTTNQRRPDVEAAHDLRGSFGFSFVPDRELSSEQIDRIRARIRSRRRFIDESDVVRLRHDTAFHAGGDLRVTVDNVVELMRREPAHYDWIRIDTVMTCNVKCVYCHNYRTPTKFTTEAIEALLYEKILGTTNFQVGCTMEPTMDRRLRDLFELVSRSPARPTRAFKLATNGSLLHRHSIEHLVAAGLNEITVSLDTFDEDTLRELRGGTSARQVAGNVARVLREFPHLRVTFTAAVSSRTIDQVDDFVARALDLGVHDFIFQELYHFPENERVARDEMNALMLREGEFLALKRRIGAKYQGQATMHFAHDAYLRRVHREYVPPRWNRSVSRERHIPIQAV